MGPVPGRWCADIAVQGRDVFLVERDRSPRPSLLRTGKGTASSHATAIPGGVTWWDSSSPGGPGGLVPHSPVDSHALPRLAVQPHRPAARAADRASPRAGPALESVPVTDTALVTR